MQTGEISFCDSVAFNIKSDDTKKFLLTRLEEKYEIKILQRHFDKWTDNSIETVNRRPHMACFRSNGNPYFLYLTTYNFQRYCIFIDKKVQQGYFLPRMIIVPVQFQEEYFEDTLFEGEMTKTKDGRWYYLANDVLVCKGVHLSAANLPKRLNLLYALLQKDYYHDRYDPFRMCVKKHFRLDELKENFKTHEAALPYTVRGLYFRPLFFRFRNILYNFNDDLVKKVHRYKVGDTNKFITRDQAVIHERAAAHVITAKAQGAPVIPQGAPAKSVPPPPPPGATKTLMVMKTEAPDIYELQDEKNVSYGIACVPSLRLSQLLRDAMKDASIMDKVPMQFELSTKFGKWVPVG